MFCYKCSKELPDDAQFCLKCGSQAPEVTFDDEAPAENAQPKRGMRTGAKVWLWIGIVLSALVTLTAIRNINRGISSTAASKGKAENSLMASVGKQEYDPIRVDVNLGSGNYVVGVDIPAGVYDITAVSGGGNVHSTNAFRGGINAIMGVAEKNDPGEDWYQQSYQNISLPDGVVLEISGVVVNLYCEEASGAPLQPRNQTGLEEVELGNGNYVAGKDFPAGVYDIIAVAGGGNVSSDNLSDGGINAIMGVAEKNDPGDDWYEQKYLHIPLDEGVTIKVSRVTIKLVPSK